MVKEHIVLEGQSLLDVSVQFYGTAERLFDLCDANNTSPDQVPAPGTTLLIPDLAPIKPEVVAQLNRERIIPATLPQDFEDEPEGPDGSGISYWTIGVDFVVQPTPEAPSDDPPIED
jgi:hypothetical protein